MSNVSEIVQFLTNRIKLVDSTLIFVKEQSFTASMPLLMATSTFRLGRLQKMLEFLTTPSLYNNHQNSITNTQLFYGPFSRTTWVSRYHKKKPSGLYGAMEDSTGRHTDYLDGLHSIRTNHRPTSIIPHFYARCPSFCNPPNLSCFGQAPNMMACIPSGVVQTTVS